VDLIGTQSIKGWKKKRAGWLLLNTNKTQTHQLWPVEECGWIQDGVLQAYRWICNFYGFSDPASLSNLYSEKKLYFRSKIIIQFKP
jgi:hypothetical protein